MTTTSGSSKEHLPFEQDFNLIFKDMPNIRKSQRSMAAASVQKVDTIEHIGTPKSILRLDSPFTLGGQKRERKQGSKTSIIFKEARFKDDPVSDSEGGEYHLKITSNPYIEALKKFVESKSTKTLGEDLDNTETKPSTLSTNNAITLEVPRSIKKKGTAPTKLRGLKPNSN